MTVIAGFSRIGDSAIAGDRLVSTSYTKWNLSGPKVFQITDKIAAGAAGPIELLHFVETRLSRYLEEIDPLDEDATHQAVRRAWKLYRSNLRKRGEGKINDDGALILSGQLLVVTPMRVYTCQTDGGVIEHEIYGAIGSGNEVALGVMHCLAEPGMVDSVATIVKAAVEAAIAHVPSCGGEVDVIEVKDVLAT